MTRADLHQLVDRLPDDELARAEVLLRALEAPIDEPVTDDDRSALDEARAELADGRTSVWVPPSQRR
jgi:hypothetical protein